MSIPVIQKNKFISVIKIEIKKIKLWKDEKCIFFCYNKEIKRAITFLIFIKILHNEY